MKRFRVFRDGKHVHDALLYKNQWALLSPLGFITPTNKYYIEIWSKFAKDSWWHMFHDAAYTVEEIKKPSVAHNTQHESQVRDLSTLKPL